MAASQKEISVSEFFAKNRHLLGFDNPRKALLTTVKEAVDKPWTPAKKRASCPKSGCISSASARIASRSACRTTGLALSASRFP